MSSVKIIDASSIIYLLSMFKNLKNSNVPYHIRGSVPKSAKNYSYLYNTGFFNFVTSTVNNIDIKRKTVMIKEGSLVLNNIAKDICDFIMEITQRFKYQIKPYYEMLIELMNNTKHHAYDNSEYVHNWYVYCQAKGNKVQIIFFDNGEGIPSTVNKTKFEAIAQWFNKKGMMVGGDIDILEAALDGAFRTRTLEEHRGKGLPMINSLIKSNTIQDTKIITNHAFYSINVKKDISESLHGTLYYWEVN